MAKNTLAALQSAFNEKRTPAPANVDSKPAPAASYQAPSRAGKLHITAWLAPDYKVSLRAIQMKFPKKTMQELFIEALNDLFTKYNVPVIREDAAKE